jgi:hypothetical protein
MDHSEIAKLKDTLFSRATQARELLRKFKYMEFADKAIAISAQYRKLDIKRFTAARKLNYWDGYLITAIEEILKNRCLQDFKACNLELANIPVNEQASMDEALALLRTQLKANQVLMLDAIEWLRASLQNGVIQPTSLQEKEYWQLLSNAGAFVVRNNRAFIPALVARDPWKGDKATEIMADVLLERRAKVIDYQFCLPYGL